MLTDSRAHSPRITEGAAMRTLVALATGALALLCASAANAAPVPISGYDVNLTPQSGFGAWQHAYNGTITPTTRELTPCFSGACPLVNETNGSGTLNDGIVSVRTNDDQLLKVGTATDTSVDPGTATAFTPTITLRLARTASVRSITVHGGNIQDNSIPGALIGASVRIGGTTRQLASVPAGDPGPVGYRFDDMLDLQGTGLDALPTNEIVVSDFTTEPTTDGQFSAAEITVDGSTLPSSTQQCLQAGWKQFGVFKNQGDCVSFVATRGKNPPAHP